MSNKDIQKSVALIIGAICLLGFVVWTVMRSGRVEQDLFSELDGLAEVDNQLCPFDGSLTRTSTALLFDFSDPLPVELGNYPDSLLEGMMDGLQDAEQFDRFGVYTLNPLARVPRSIGTFCVPVTMNQIPRDIRQTLWGTDPEQYSTLPARYERFEEIFEYLWENDEDLKESMEDVREALDNESQRQEQSFSRIIENIEEIAGLEIDRNSRQIKFLVLSDMLQNSPGYSHYSQGLDYENYHSIRREPWLDMSRFSFEIYLVQSCFSLGTERRRSLMQFWDSYFEEQGAAVDFRLLNIDGRDCSIQEPDITEDQGQSGETRIARETIRSPSASVLQDSPPSGVQTPTVENDRLFGDSSLDVPNSGTSGGVSPELTRTEELAADSRTDETSTDSAVLPSNAARQIPEENLDTNDDRSVNRADCIAPTPSRLPPLGYPRNARGTALVRYTITVDAEGLPVEYEPIELEIDRSRYEGAFLEHAEEYIADLRFEISMQEGCDGERVAQLGLRFEG